MAAGGIVLDVTRTVSLKSIATPTGIDRVERAYVEYFLESDRPVWFVCRVGRGQAIFDVDGMREVYTRVLGKVPWGKRDIRGMFRGVRGQIETDLRQHATWVGAGPGIAENVAGGFTYLNVGHTNLETKWLQGLRRAGADRIIGLIHDMIPMDHPEWQTSKSVVRFAARMQSLAEVADLVVTNSDYTASRVFHWFEIWGGRPEIVSNHLGVKRPPEVEAHRCERPYFVQLGTIEPRKNHALTLGLWEEFQALPQSERPVLHIIGRRGWENEAVFDALGSAPFVGHDVFVHEDLGDEQTTAFLKGARALLFPSLAEGFGYPLLEAAQLGVLTLASDLPVFHEFEAAPVLYFDPTRANDWKKAIIDQLSEASRAPGSQGILNEDVPRWNEHFERLERIL